MSGQPDTSDDLIAELAKLMATNAKPEPVPVPVKPANTTAAAPTPIRIPGSDQPPRIPGGDVHAAVETRPAVEARPAAPVVRIPGMDMPPPGAAANTSAPPAAVHAQPFEPKIVTSEHAIPQTPLHVVSSTPAPVPVQPPAPAPVTDFDPIAALIAAELDTSTAAPPATETQRPAPAKFTPAPRPANSSSGPRPMPLSLAGQGKAAPATPITVKPVQGPRPIPVESDTFGVAPNVGVGKHAMPSDHDPMREIESLIGEAVRVEMDRPAPVVTPVGGLAPRRTQPIETKPETAPRSADEAILAAAAATGADVGVLETPREAPVADEPEASVVIPPDNARRPSGNMRQYIGMAVAGTLLLAAGFGLYWVLGLGRSDGNVPVLSADASPVKVAPDPQTTASTEAETSSPVLNELDGVNQTAESETLVSTDQSTETDVADLSNSEVLDSGLANRKVRTVTVRPDGTIVSGEDAVAGSEALPVSRPNVPEVPGDAATATDVLANAAEGVAQDPIAAVIANPDAVATTELALADPATATPVPPVNLDPSIPVPMPPLANRQSAPIVSATDPVTPVATTDTTTETALTTTGPLDLLGPGDIAAPQPTQTAETSSPVQSSPGNPAPAYVQLSAQRDQDTALADARRFTDRFASVIGNTALEVHIVDLGAKGTWYRVLLPASSASAANTACNNIKAAGGDCLIR